MLFAPFLKNWTFVRSPEHIAGGHRYLPPRQDINAPDLYIPLMALWTYCMLVGIGLLARGGFRPEAMYNAVSSALGSWLCQTLLLKGVLWVLGVGGTAPLLELGAYSGYTWVWACATLLATLSNSRMGYHVVWVYSSFASALFLVRTMRRVILQVGEEVFYGFVRFHSALPFSSTLSRIQSTPSLSPPFIRRNRGRTTPTPRPTITSSWAWPCSSSRSWPGWDGSRGTCKSPEAALCGLCKVFCLNECLEGPCVLPFCGALLRICVCARPDFCNQGICNDAEKKQSGQLNV